MELHAFELLAQESEQEFRENRCPLLSALE